MFMARYLVNTEQLRNCSKHLVTLISIHPLTRAEPLYMCLCSKANYTVSSKRVTGCQHVWGTLGSLSCDHNDLCADNILILRSGCTVDSGWRCIMRVSYVGRSGEHHQRRLQRREEPSWIKPAAEQRVKYLQKRLGRSEGRLYIKPAAVFKAICRLFLHMWVSRHTLLTCRCIAGTCLIRYKL